MYFFGDLDFSQSFEPAVGISFLRFSIFYLVALEREFPESSYFHSIHATTQSNT